MVTGTSHKNQYCGISHHMMSIGLHFHSREGLRLNKFKIDLTCLPIFVTKGKFH